MKSILVIPPEFKEELKTTISQIVASSLRQAIADKAFHVKDELISLKEVASYFDVSLVTIHKWRNSGQLPPSIKQGGKVFFKRAEIEQMLNQKKSGRS